jgi:hypothetical protein
MSQSSQSILDLIAEMLRFISNTQSFWFTLDTSYNHGCHLANRFRLEPKDYEVLLLIAGLAHYTRFGFAMKPTAWSKFLVGHLSSRCAAHSSSCRASWLLCASPLVALPSPRLGWLSHHHHAASWCGASLGGAQSNVFNPTLRLINRRVFTFGALIAS